ncbi:MAG TPA: hypothetical protein VLM83_00925, partial [Anaerolineales bacterium]|nr:hypothetical protein [Anaerolineales bacterium]
MLDSETGIELQSGAAAEQPRLNKNLFSAAQNVDIVLGQLPMRRWIQVGDLVQNIEDALGVVIGGNAVDGELAAIGAAVDEHQFTLGERRILFAAEFQRQTD